MVSKISKLKHYG